MKPCISFVQLKYIYKQKFRKLCTPPVYCKEFQVTRVHLKNGMIISHWYPLNLCLIKKYPFFFLKLTIFKCGFKCLVANLQSHSLNGGSLKMAINASLRNPPKLFVILIRNCRKKCIIAIFLNIALISQLDQQAQQVAIEKWDNYT